MRKILTISLILSMLAVNAFARDAVSKEEKSTYRKLRQERIIDGRYTEKELNQPISRIDSMSLTIKATRDKAKTEDIVNVYRNMSAQDKHLSERAKTDLTRVENQLMVSEINPIKGDIDQLKAQGEMNAWLFLITIAIALVF